MIYKLSYKLNQTNEAEAFHALRCGGNWQNQVEETDRRGTGAVGRSRELRGRPASAPAEPLLGRVRLRPAHGARPRLQHERHVVASRNGSVTSSAAADVVVVLDRDVTARRSDSTAHAPGRTAAAARDTIATTSSLRE